MTYSIWGRDNNTTEFLGNAESRQGMLELAKQHMHDWPNIDYEHNTFGYPEVIPITKNGKLLEHQEAK